MMLYRYEVLDIYSFLTYDKSVIKGSERMNKKEMCRLVQIDIKQFEYYEQQGFFYQNEKEYDDEDVKKLSLIMTLNDIGLQKEEIKRFVQCIEQGNATKTQRKEILLRKRKELLEDIHQFYHSIDAIDYLICQIEGYKNCQ